MCGIGFFTIFQAALNYLIDTFQRYAASAGKHEPCTGLELPGQSANIFCVVAANTFLRSAFAGAFPLFISPMLHNLGLGWGISVFALFSCLLLPIPYLFYTFGKRIRARGRWSRESTL